MSVSAMFGCRLVIAPSTFTSPPPFRRVSTAPLPQLSGGLVIESSSRPQKKATAHHRKTRPKKTQPWDVKRGAAVYPPLPELPPEWTLVSEDASAATDVAAIVATESVSV